MSHDPEIDAAPAVVREPRRAVSSAHDLRSTPTTELVVSARQLSRLLALTVAIFMAVTIAALAGVTHPLDRALRLDAWLTNDALDETLKFVERPGQRVVVLPVLFAATAYLGWRLRSWRPIVATATAVLLVNACVGGIKWWSDRATPRLGGPGFFDEAGNRLLGAYPSGHATNVGMWAVLAWFLSGYAQQSTRRWIRGAALTWVGVIVLCSWARTTHWITDLIAGVALGAACSCFGLLIARWGRLPGASRPSPEVDVQSPQQLS